MAEYSDLSLRERGLRPGAGVRAEILYRQQGRCGLCGTEEWRTKKRFHLHRVIKGRDGGLYEVENLLALCPSCHKTQEREEGE